MQIDCGNISGMIDVQHLTPIVSRNADARHIAVGGSIDRRSHTIIASYAQVDATVEMIGAYLGKSA